MNSSFEHPILSKIIPILICEFVRCWVGGGAYSQTVHDLHEVLLFLLDQIFFLCVLLNVLTNLLHFLMLLVGFLFSSLLDLQPLRPLFFVFLNPAIDLSVLLRDLVFLKFWVGGS